jgi:diaminohydroxyphosphoribosylaminopyrimidine deaminase/5-amino-6-(5-phosphoribosylamino)uracil reductase
VDNRYLDQAIELASRGRGCVEPNPMVGCVVVRHGQIIGQGFHEHFGGPHAEPNALESCRESPEGATVYVNLEPCCHTNKKTPPCVSRLISAKIGRVVVGCVDPNPGVSGVGIAQLRAAGVDVAIGGREAESKQLNAPFFAVQTQARPYVTLKWAESADRRVAGPGGRRMQISGERALRAAHLLRAGFDALLIGIQTALTDDPLLTTRGIPAHRPLLRVVLDSAIRLPPTSRLATTAAEHPTHLFCTRLAGDASLQQRAAALRAVGVHIHDVPADPLGRVDLPAVLRWLTAELRVTHLMVEGGPAVHDSFLRQNLADRAWVVRSPMRIEASDAPMATSLPDHFEQTKAIVLGPDRLSEYLNRHSPLFFAGDPSVDITELGSRLKK